MKSHIFQLGFVLGLLCGPAQGQISQPIIPESFVETQSEESLIAVPHWLRGLQFAAEPSQARPSLRVILPAAWNDKKVCARATTIDGRFLVTGQYKLPAQIDKTALELDYPTKFPATWSDTTTATGGIVLSEGDCDTPTTTGTGSRLVPAVFNGLRDLKRDQDGRVSLVFAVHARNTQELQSKLLTAQGALPALCSKMATSDAIQFNFLCTVALAPDTHGNAELVVTRLNKGRKAPPLQAMVMLPDLR